MPNSYADYGSKSSGDTITVPFSFISRAHVSVLVDGEAVATNKWSWANDGLLNCLSGFPSGTVTRVKRTTPTSAMQGSLTGSAVFDYQTTNKNFNQVLYITQERIDAEADAITQAEAAEESAEAAAASATAAATAETNAETAETNAETAQAAAAASASAAAQSVLDAQTHQQLAATYVTRAGYWASQAEDVQVPNPPAPGAGYYSALHWAAKAEDSAAAAATSETNAETAETNAETAETNAETAQAAAAASASAAATSETNASNSAIAAAASAATFTTVEAQITAATTDSTPIDTDTVGYVSDTGFLRKMTWANLKTALKSAFEALDWTFTGKIITKPSATGGAGLNIPAGTLPTSPVAGDLAYDTNLNFRHGANWRNPAWTGEPNTFSRRSVFRTPTASEASVRLPVGADQTSGQTEGDAWSIAGAIRAYLQGGNKTVHIGSTKPIFFGFQTANAADTANDITFGAGTCGDNDGAYLFSVAALTKRADAAWAAGNNQGGLDTGSIADDTYHSYAIFNPTTLASDIIWSLSATWAGVTKPSGFTVGRYLWPHRRTSGSWQQVWHCGPVFRLKAVIEDRSSTSAQANTLLALSVPTDVVVQAHMNGLLTCGAAATLFMDVGDAAGSTTTEPLAGMAASAADSAGGKASVFTDTSGQVRFQQVHSSGSPTVAKLYLSGWTIHRDLMP